MITAQEKLAIAQEGRDLADALAKFIATKSVGIGAVAIALSTVLRNLLDTAHEESRGDIGYIVNRVLNTPTDELIASGEQLRAEAAKEGRPQ